MVQSEIQFFKKTLAKLNLMSDVFSSAVFEDKMACQYVLRILLSKPDLVVEEVLTQKQLRQINAKTAILDVLATDSQGNKYDIEIQRSDALNHAKRVRFYASAIDSHYMGRGKDYEELPDVYVIYISETDIWGYGKVRYTVEKSLMEGVPYDDGQHILYVNAEIKDDSEISKLMEYFKTADPNDMSHGDLSKRVNYFKSSEGGQKDMCEIMNQIRNDGFQQGIQQGVQLGCQTKAKAIAESMLKDGLALEFIAKYCDLSLEEVMKLKAEIEN